MSEEYNFNHTEQENSESTGNGSYNYNSFENSFEEVKPSRKNKKSGKFLRTLGIAAVFGVCAGVGIWGINTVYGKDVRESARASVNGSSQKAVLNIDNEDDKDEKILNLAKKTEEKTEAEDAAAEEETGEASTGIKLDENIGHVTDVTKVVADVMPSMVSVFNNYTVTGRDFFGQTYSQEGQGAGSGIIISKTDDELLIATNNHVVEGSDSLQVQFINEKTADALIKGTDSGNDLAVIAVDLDDIDEDTMKEIEVATLGNSDKLLLGEPVVAIGNALGYGQSVTTGVVSALNREISMEGGSAATFIQTDAAINPGNSGGALVDLNGKVVGINSNKIGGSTVEGMGYAIPISRAVPIIEDLMNQKTKELVAEENRGYLGISGVSVTSQVASAYGMPQGAYVVRIFEDGGAADSDLQKGDIITSINKSSVDSMEALQKQLKYYEAGEEVVLSVKRADGQGEYEDVEVTITLGDKNTLEDESDDKSGKEENRPERPDAEEDDADKENNDDSSAREEMPREYGGNGEQGQYGFGDFYNFFPWGSFFGR